MIAELFYVAFVTIFIGLVILGHALLISAVYQCWCDDRTNRRHSNQKAPDLEDRALPAYGP